MKSAFQLHKKLINMQVVQRVSFFPLKRRCLLQPLSMWVRGVFWFVTYKKKRNLWLDYVNQPPSPAGHHRAFELLAQQGRFPRWSNQCWKTSCGKITTRLLKFRDEEPVFMLWCMLMRPRAVPGLFHPHGQTNNWRRNKMNTLHKTSMVLNGSAYPTPSPVNKRNEGGGPKWGRDTDTHTDSFVAWWVRPLVQLQLGLHILCRESDADLDPSCDSTWGSREAQVYTHMKIWHVLLQKQFTVSKKYIYIFT